MTGYGTVQSAVQAMKNGAYDYVTKPFSMEELRGSHTDRERIVRLRQRSIHGAVQSRDGLLAIAEGGTVLLDEVGELPVDLQAKLLRSIQEREIRLWAAQTYSIHVRILAATDRDLEQAVAQEPFAGIFTSG